MGKTVNHKYDEDNGFRSHGKKKVQKSNYDKYAKQSLMNAIYDDGNSNFDDYDEDDYGY